MKSKYLVLNYVFVGAVFLLFLNDHFLKEEFHNWFTGKFSDFLGMIILPLFLAFVFPGLKYFSIPISALFFIFWKSPYSEEFIRLYNEISPIDITRVVDYTDLLAFIFLPIPFILLKNKDLLYYFRIEKVNVVFVLIPSIFVMMATSQPRPLYYRYHRQGNVNFYKNNTFVISKSEKEIFEQLKKQNITFKKDTFLFGERVKWLYNDVVEKDSLSKLSKGLPFKMDKDSLKNEIKERMYYDSNYYLIDSLKIDDETLKDISFGVFERENKRGKKETEIVLASLKTEKNLTDKKVKQKLEKVYKRLLRKKIFGGKIN